MVQIFRSARFIAAIGLIVTLAVAAFADTLRLKDGSIIKGRIVTFGGGKFIVVVGEGTRQRQLTFDADEIDSIQFDAVRSGTAETVSTRQAEPAPKKDPQFIPTSGPPKNIPRVVTTDPMATSASKPAQVPRVPESRVMEPAKNSGAKPIEVSVKVLADNTSNGWTNSGWVVKKGQKIRIIGGGTISLGKGRSTGAAGLYEVEDPTKLLKSVPTGALIAVVGDDNNEFIYIGSERTFTATRDGALFLGVNEGNLDDNSGTFEVRVEIEPA